MIYVMILAVFSLIYEVEIMLEFPAKEAILNLRQSSVFAVFKIHGRVNSGEHSKAAAFAGQSRHDFSEPKRSIRVS
jgi:hypothetical protein